MGTPQFTAGLNSRDNLLDVFERLANTILGQLILWGDFSPRQAHQETVSGDSQFGVSESAAVSQAGYVLAVCQPSDQIVDSSSDDCVADAGQLSHLTKAGALVQIHSQQKPILSAEQLDSASQQVNFVPVGPF